MFRLSVTLVICVCISVVRSQLQELQCPAPDKTSPIKVTVSGRRNQTGHWFTQVGVEHRKALDDLVTGNNSRSSDEWTLGIEHSSVVCNNLELTTNIVLTFSVPLPKTLPGYKLLPGYGYYNLHVERTTWAGARATCTKEGGHLVVIHSEGEAAAIATMAGTREVWAGIYEEGADGKYFTVFGEPATVNTTGYLTWFPGEPNDKTVGNCLLFAINGAHGYNDYLCNTNYPFLCKQ